LDDVDAVEVDKYVRGIERIEKQFPPVPLVAEEDE
jgi:hypothetical protein